MNLKHLRRQFAARDHNRPLANCEPWVVSFLQLEPVVTNLLVHLLVYQRIEYLDDVFADSDRVGHECRMVEKPTQSLGYISLAGTRGAIDKDGPARVERRPQPVEHSTVQNDIFERRPHAVLGHRSPVDCLRS